MSYEVLARKYRPQTFDELVGQDHVVTTLKNAIQNNRVAHAYLFVGPRGTGKTSTARILAKALNCAEGPTPSPCNVCETCLGITAGNNLDVLEIDGASNNGVEQVRELRDNVRFMPTQGPYKIYIIDEVHMLTTAAFNALLKTLEEPPPHVKFIFATTEPHKVPTTIMSRCQRFDLRRIQTPHIVEQLKKIAQLEGVEADERVFLAIARGSEGGMRDAQSALDQLISFKGKSIVEADVLSVFGIAASEQIGHLVKFLLEGSVPEVLQIVSELDQEGRDLHRVLFDVLNRLRHVMIYSYTKDEKHLSDCTEAEIEEVKALAASANASRISRMTELLIDAEGKLRYALNKRTMLEMALVRSARSVHYASIDEIVTELEALKNAVSTGGTKVEPEAKKKDILVQPEPVQIKETSSEEPSKGVDDVWPRFLTDCEKILPELVPLLKQCQYEGLQNGKVQVNIPSDIQNKAVALTYPKCTNIFNGLLEKVTGSKCVIHFEGLIQPKPIQEEVSKELEHEKPKKAHHEWVEDPSVRKTLEMFNGDIVDVKE